MRSAIGIAIFLAACSSQAGETVVAAQPSAEAESAKVHPVSGLEIIPLTLSQDGKTHEFKVEVARSAAEWSRGLMFREEMGADEGMIFVGREGQPASFWMRNTVIPLDIVFIGTDNRILNYYPMTEPFSLESLPSIGPTNAVLEINGGRLEELGFSPGAKVEWQD
ncbi:MAG TPA: DUF192 domain-containing protein [Sphingomonadaceae bacterium]|nr:DUF192 domain-containing protein [Sphingomonadaceae bacterium]